jgi:ketosteroid isomerase-like protein
MQAGREPLELLQNPMRTYARGRNNAENQNACFLRPAFTTTRLFAQARPEQKGSGLTGTWFGDFILKTPDGKASHDTAVLLLEQHGSAATGSIGGTVDQQTPFTDGGMDGGNIRFHLDAGGGMDFGLHLAAGRLEGGAVGKAANAEVSLQPVPGLLPKQKLMEEITEADRHLCEAFGACDVARYSGFLAKDLEFYQDRTGKTSFEQDLKALRDRCAEGIMLRVELVEASLVVNAVPGYGAIEAGAHRFCLRQPDGSEHLDATAQFTCVWSKESGSWKLVRVISYDHR